jgi:hypothetical protein
MARMIPFPMLPTDSSAERRLYEGFLEQLSDEYVVYHSVDWVMSPRGGDAQGSPEQGEADFVIAHPEDGVLAVEAKGGTLRYEPDTRRWTQSGHSGPHPLHKDPFVQARSEIRSLMRILERQPGFERWRPSFGHGLAFPVGRYAAAAPVRRGRPQDRRAHERTGLGARVRPAPSPGGRDRAGRLRQDVAGHRRRPPSL